MAIGDHKRHESGTKFPLGHYDDLSAIGLNARFGPRVQLVGAFGRHQNVPKLAINALWKFHFLSPSLTPPDSSVNPSRTRMLKSKGHAACALRWSRILRKEVPAFTAFNSSRTRPLAQP
jgi:hypothetical protein